MNGLNLEAIAKRHRQHGILLDANLLVLWIVGTVDTELIARHKRLSAYHPDHFHALRWLLARFSKLVTTPHVLTEASNIAMMIQLPLRREILLALGQGVGFESTIGVVKERYVPASKLAELTQFSSLGIADAAVLDAARRKVLVLTDDSDLLFELAGEKLACFSFLRPINQITVL